MDNEAQTGKAVPERAKEGKARPLREASAYSSMHPKGRDRYGFHLGIDVGSTSSDVVLLSEDGEVIFCDYQRTKGRPVETLRLQMQKVFDQVEPLEITLSAATGSVGRFLAKLLDIPFVNEVPAQAAAICRLYAQLEQATIIEMGGQDSKLIFLSRQAGRTRIRDFTLNTVCAAGTGSFLDQQAQRLGINIEGEFGQLALQSKTIPRMAGRCSVFAKSDMIHLQQQATPTCDIIAGLCLALARNLRSNLGCGRDFVKPIIFTGGVAANVGVVRALEQAFDLKRGELVVPEMHFFTGAIGAVLIAKDKAGRGRNGQIDLGRIDSYLSQQGAALEGVPRREPLSCPVAAPPSGNGSGYEARLKEADGPINAYLGVDVGSISTNVAVIDEQKRLLAKAYLMTAGKPLEAVRQGLEMVRKKVTGNVKILGVATTGSGRYLTGDFIGADIVINEITAQAEGAKIVNPTVDTIFEIGGQDSKYISLENGVVVDFEMNHACAAGTGSFLEEQAQRLGINIDVEFAELALASNAPIKLGERCTVFMESDLLSYQQQGAQTTDLVAGLSYSIVTNYLNRVVGRRRIGNNICFQGGTAFNKAVWSAFERVTGKKITVPAHHEVTGAIGAAVIAAERMKDKTKGSHFRGFENLISVKYEVESFACEHCPNHCEIKKVQLPSVEPLYYGSRCDRYNLKKKAIRRKGFCAFEYRKRKMLEFAGLAEDNTTGEQPDQSASRGRVGIPMALVGWQLLPLFSRFFKVLGFEVVLSGWTNKKIIRSGVETVTAQPCFPVKVACGHIAELIDRKVDYIFLPSIVSMTASYPLNKHNQLCPYVQTIGYQAKTAFSDKCGRAKILTVPIRMGEGQKLLRKSFVALGKKLRASAAAVRGALEEALSAQRGFELALKDKGAEILAHIGPDQRLFVLISRAYNGCDDGMNLRVPQKLADLGVEMMPMDMLNLDEVSLSDQALHSRVYWTYGQKILRAAEAIRSDPRLFAVYLSNFACGPDSFLQTFFKDIMGNKPCLQLEIDEHSADAGVLTRLEAFLESLKHYQAKSACEETPFLPERGRYGVRRSIRGAKLYIPYMGDCSYGVAASLRAYGQAAEVMPIADEMALLQGRAFTCGKECLPCAITTGEMLKIVKAKDFDPAKTAFFMPSASGPCRFGMYNCMHRLILKCAGAADVPVISPNQDSSFFHEFSESIGEVSESGFMKNLWVATAGVDLLRKLILRLRPFAEDAKMVQQVYDRSLVRWVQAVEEHRNLAQMCQLMQQITEEFEMVPMNLSARKPRVGIVGEIYVRSHPFANRNIIARLEELGVACDLASLAEWVYYINFTQKQMTWRRGQLRGFFDAVIRDYVQHRIEKRLAGPLEKRFGKLAEGPVEHVIELAAPYLHHSFEGEAILSIGKIVEYYEEGISGVVNVMPFSCMPSTIVSSQTMRVSTDCENMPILNLSFDGQEDATLPTHLEAFVEQVAARQQASQGILQVIEARR